MAEPGLAARAEAAMLGATGTDGFDHWARKLVATGHLHNHARMWFASIWIFTLRLPWEPGADFFPRHLIDGDPASNTLSRRWVGSATPTRRCSRAAIPPPFLPMPPLKACARSSPLTHSQATSPTVWPHSTHGFFRFCEAVTG